MPRLGIFVTCRSGKFKVFFFFKELMADTTLWEKKGYVFYKITLYCFIQGLFSLTKQRPS